MDDTISRQAAIDALKEHRAMYCDNTPDTFSKLSYAEKSRVDELDTAIATLVNLPSAQPERKKGQWTPCSERLPESDGFYLVCAEDIHWWKNRLTAIAHYKPKYKSFWFDGDDEYKVIAWMPLPTYEGVKE